MRRLVVAPLVLWIACEPAPPSPKPTPREQLDFKSLPVPLPARGYALETSGIGGSDLEIIDSDARTFRVIVQGPNNEHLDRTVQLDEATARRLDLLAAHAWHEVPHGDMPSATDIMQDLFIVDHDDAFHLRGYPIEAKFERDHTGRPLASDLVIEVMDLALRVRDAK